MAWNLLIKGKSFLWMFVLASICIFGVGCAELEENSAWDPQERPAMLFNDTILVDIYDSLGNHAAFLRADSGTMDMKLTHVFAYGRVFALTPQGASVRADSLLWHKKDNMVRTDSPVRVVSEEGDVLQGTGFRSDARMENWQILSDITGIFQDAARRLKEEDKKQAEDRR